MKKLFIIILCSIVASSLAAQTKEQRDSIKQTNLNEVVISGNKFSEKKKNIVQKIDVITQKEMKQMNAQSMADVLINTGQVFVQKSQQGGGSPVIRGFEASRVQLNVDGIRQNNAIFRTGHLQNIISIDNNALERVEVLSGPASTIHGSDALGGVVSMKTIDPKFSKTKKTELNGMQALVRYSTANKEKTANVGFHIGSNKIASFTNITYASFDDLRQGRNGVDSIMKLWKKNFIVERIDNKDSMVANPDPYKQVASGYSQIDLLEKIIFKPNEKYKHSLNLQLSNSSDIPRYDRLSETINGIARHAEWYYGPQKRTLAAYTFDVLKMKSFFQELTTNISHQFLQESRNNRGFNRPNLAQRTEKINVLGYNIAARHKSDEHELTIGSDGQFNFLKSTAIQTNVLTNIDSKVDTRYPDGKNNMNLLGVFFQHTWKLNDKRIVLNDGIRFNFSTLHSTIKDSSIQFNLPISDLRQQNKALTGNMGVAFMPTDELRLTANISSGFRSPNFDDMAKVFESNNSMLIVPNQNLKPEYTQNGEVGIGYNDGELQINAYGFYTQFNNAIVLDKFTFNGQDSVLYNGNMTRVFASQNKAKAFLYGAGFDFNYRPILHFSLYGSMNYTYGRFNQGDSLLIPLDHIPPVTGRFGIKYSTRQWYAELYSLYNGKKRLVDYNPGGEDNLIYSTPNGAPSWYTINLRAGFTVAKYVQIQLGIENVLDRNYRYFASGMSAPGRNLVLAVRFNK